MMETKYILMWAGYGIFMFFFVLLVVCVCWRGCLRPRNQNSCLITEVTISSNNQSSEGLTYYACPKAPFTPLPAGTTDGLSDFDSSILVDQPMILSHTNPYCRQKATISASSTPCFTTITNLHHLNKNINYNQTISDDEGNYSIDGAIRSFDNSILSIQSSDSDDDEFRLTTMYSLNEIQQDFSGGIKIPQAVPYKRTTVR